MTPRTTLYWKHATGGLLVPGHPERGCARAQRLADVGQPISQGFWLSPAKMAGRMEAVGKGLCETYWVVALRFLAPITDVPSHIVWFLSLPESGMVTKSLLELLILIRNMRMSESVGLVPSLVPRAP